MVIFAARSASDELHRDAWELLYAALSSLGEDCRSLAVVRSELGKPYFPDRPDIAFSLSHTDGAVACAVSAASALLPCDVSARGREIAERFIAVDHVGRSPSLGCDIESLARISKMPPRRREAIGRRFLGGESDGASAEEFAKSWVQAEARAKYTGIGLGGISQTCGNIIYEGKLTLGGEVYFAALCGE